MKGCLFRRTCRKKDTEICNKFCYPYVLLMGQDGKTGFWGATGVPAKYKSCLIDNLPIKKDNPKAFEIIEKYLSKIDSFVEEKNVGLFLFSIPNRDNIFGTGTGKTTSAVTVLNEYVIHKVKQHLRGEAKLENNPALFIKASEFQNLYNAQFRGTFDMQQEASVKFYRSKDRMKGIALLVIDDIAVRDSTDAFKNELYEIIDYRATEGKATLFTSNIPLDKLIDVLGHRIVSRIEGMTFAVGFQGKDKRKEGLF